MSSTEQEEVGDPWSPEPETPGGDVAATHADMVPVGGEDFVHRLMRRDLNDLPEDSDEFRRACDVVRVYLGTLLKTDQVSFLLGAGSSLDAGGVLFRSIPYQVERSLLQQGLDSGGSAESWLSLFYSAVSICHGDAKQDPAERAERIEEIEQAILVGDPDGTTVKDLAGAFEIQVNFEDFLSKLHTWSAGLVADKIGVTSANGGKLLVKREDLHALITQLAKALAEACMLPVASCEDRLKHHRLFVQRLLTRPLNLRRVSLFTLNYDTLIEQAMDSCGVVAIDGFVGSLRRVFRPESYDHDLYFPGDTTEGRVHRLDRVMHLHKLHGSVSWRTVEPDWDNPYGLYATGQDDSIHNDVLIYPTPLKQSQALGLPYSEMFRRFASNVVRPQSVLFVSGYGFGDEHVNAIIRQALVIPSFTLVVIDPRPLHPFVTQLIENRDKRVCVISGPRFGTFSGFVERLLPDLDEEQVIQAVVKTYKALDPKQLAPTPASSGEGDGQ